MHKQLARALKQHFKSSLIGSKTAEDSSSFAADVRARIPEDLITQELKVAGLTNLVLSGPEAERFEQNLDLLRSHPELEYATDKAKEKLMLEQLEEGIVCLASACEIASTQFIQRKGLTNDPLVDRILRQRKSFAEKRYDEITLFAVGRSLKTENPSAFVRLENAYKTRNSVVHNGELKYYDSMSSQQIRVTRSMINDYFRSCELAIDWIEAL